MNQLTWFTHRVAVKFHGFGVSHCTARAIMAATPHKVTKASSDSKILRFGLDGITRMKTRINETLARYRMSIFSN